MVHHVVGVANLAKTSVRKMIGADRQLVVAELPEGAVGKFYILKMTILTSFQMREISSTRVDVIKVEISHRLTTGNGIA